MNRGPTPGTRAVASDFRSRVIDAWGASAPDWIFALAAEAQRTTASAVAARIGYSPSVVSQVFSASYRGDLGKVEAKVRGALMGSTVECPVLGEIGLDRCRDEQARGFSATNATRAQLRRACKTCPHRSSNQEIPHG